MIAQTFRNVYGASFPQKLRNAKSQRRFIVSDWFLRGRRWCWRSLRDCASSRRGQSVVSGLRRDCRRLRSRRSPCRRSRLAASSLQAPCLCRRSRGRESLLAIGKIGADDGVVASLPHRRRHFAHASPRAPHPMDKDDRIARRIGYTIDKRKRTAVNAANRDSNGDERCD